MAGAQLLASNLPCSMWLGKICGCGSKPMGSHFGAFGAPPMLVYVSGDWDVHWGYDLGFDPWPCVHRSMGGTRDAGSAGLHLEGPATAGR